MFGPDSVFLCPSSSDCSVPLFLTLFPSQLDHLLLHVGFNLYLFWKEKIGNNFKVIKLKPNFTLLTFFISQISWPSWLFFAIPVAVMTLATGNLKYLHKIYEKG